MPVKTPEDIIPTKKEKSFFQKIKEKIDNIFSETNLTFLGKIYVLGIICFGIEAGLMMAVSFIQGIFNFIIKICGKEAILKFPEFWTLSTCTLIPIGIMIVIITIVELVGLSDGCSDSILINED